MATRATILTFDVDRTKRHAEHSRAANRRKPTFAQMYDPNLRHDGEEPEELPTSEEVDLSKVPAGLHLVKDRGIYLMSNGVGVKADFEETEDVKDGEYVSYAEGYGPQAPHDRLRRAVGGDDFTQFLPLEWFGGRPKIGFVIEVVLGDQRRPKEFRPRHDVEA